MAGLVTRSSRVLSIAAIHWPFSIAVFLVIALIISPRPAAAQWGPSVPGHFGGETSAAALVNAGTLMVARGAEVEMFSLANPAAPAPYSPRRRAGLDAPAVNISMTQGSSKAFVLLAAGDAAGLYQVAMPTSWAPGF